MAVWSSLTLSCEEQGMPEDKPPAGPPSSCCPLSSWRRPWARARSWPVSLLSDAASLALVSQPGLPANYSWSQVSGPHLLSLLCHQWSPPSGGPQLSPSPGGRTRVSIEWWVSGLNQVIWREMQTLFTDRSWSGGLDVIHSVSLWDALPICILFNEGEKCKFRSKWESFVRYWANRVLCADSWSFIPLLCRSELLSLETWLTLSTSDVTSSLGNPKGPSSLLSIQPIKEQNPRCWREVTHTEGQTPGGYISLIQVKKVSIRSVIIWCANKRLERAVSSLPSGEASNFWALFMAVVNGKCINVEFPTKS